jgi:hypothetical protein
VKHASSILVALFLEEGVGRGLRVAPLFTDGLEARDLSEHQDRAIDRPLTASPAQAERTIGSTTIALAGPGVPCAHAKRGAATRRQSADRDSAARAVIEAQRARLRGDGLENPPRIKLGVEEAAREPFRYEKPQPRRRASPSRPRSLPDRREASRNPPRAGPNPHRPPQRGSLLWGEEVRCRVAWM